jgi:hypothetical protein
MAMRMILGENVHKEACFRTRYKTHRPSELDPLEIRFYIAIGEGRICL